MQQILKKDLLTTLLISQIEDVSVDDLTALLEVGNESEKEPEEASADGKQVNDGNAKVVETSVANSSNGVTEPQAKVVEPIKETTVKKESTPKALSKEPEFLRVQMSVLEDLINMVSELVLTRNQLLQMMRAQKKVRH